MLFSSLDLLWYVRDHTIRMHIMITESSNYGVIAVVQNKIPMNILKGDIIITYYTAWPILVCVCQWLCTGPRGEVPRSYMTIAKCMKHYWLFSSNNYLLRIKPLIHLSGIKIIDVVECHYLWNDLEWMKQREFLSTDFADILPILVTSCILQ